MEARSGQSRAPDWVEEDDAVMPMPYDEIYEKYHQAMEEPMTLIPWKSPYEVCKECRCPMASITPGDLSSFACENSTCKMFGVKLPHRPVCRDCNKLMERQSSHSTMFWCVNEQCMRFHTSADVHPRPLPVQAQLGQAIRTQPYESVNHPSHYNSHPAGIECIDVIEAFNLNIGNAIKYLWRAGLKPGTAAQEDLRKAQWYVNREIERIGKGAGNG